MTSLIASNPAAARVRKLTAITLAVIFLCFAGYLLWHHQFMHLYHDDFGYASLSYADIENDVRGQQFSIHQLLTYLKAHYHLWGGRILFFFFEIILLRLGMPVFRIAQIVMILLIYFFSFLIAVKPTERFSMHSIMTILSGLSIFGLFSLNTYRTGVYWATASVLYVFPMALFLILVYYLMKRDQSNNPSQTIRRPMSFIWISLGFFVVSFSQEQISIAVLVFLGAYFIWQYVKTKRVTWDNIVLILASGLGTFILFVAPGNKVRMMTTPEFYELSLSQRIIQNVPRILSLYFSRENSKIALLLFLLGALACLVMLSETQRRWRITIISVLMGHIAAFIGYLDQVVMKDTGLVFDWGSLLMTIGAAIYLLILFATIGYAIFVLGSNHVLILYIGVLASQATMLNTPYLVDRMMLPFLLVLSPICMLFMDRVLRPSGKRWTQAVVVFLCLVTCVIAMMNMLHVTEAYKRNSPYLERNDQILRSSAAAIASGEKINRIDLNKLPPEGLQYAGDQPYFETFKFVVRLIREYYDIPKDVELVWHDVE